MPLVRRRPLLRAACDQYRNDDGGNNSCKHPHAFPPSIRALVCVEDGRVEQFLKERNCEAIIRTNPGARSGNVISTGR